jgi:hypothetical protein
LNFILYFRNTANCGGLKDHIFGNIFLVLFTYNEVFFNKFLTSQHSVS